MADLTFTRSSELEVTEVEGDTDAGIEFVDAWQYPDNLDEMVVVDMGRIIVPTRVVPTIEAAAREKGLSYEYGTVDT